MFTFRKVFDKCGNKDRMQIKNYYDIDFVTSTILFDFVISGNRCLIFIIFRFSIETKSFDKEMQSGLVRGFLFQYAYTISTIFNSHTRNSHLNIDSVDLVSPRSLNPLV